MKGYGKLNSLYDLCEYGYKIKDVIKLKEYGITIKDICDVTDNNIYKYNKIYYNARKIYKNHKDVFNNDSIYELHEYGVSIAIIDSIKSKITIKEIRNYSDKYLKDKYDIKYNTLSKIRNCGYFKDMVNVNEKDNKKEDYDEIIKLRKYGVSQNVINKILSNDIKIKDLLSYDIDEIVKKLDVSKPTACKVEDGLEKYMQKENIRKPLKKVLQLYIQEESKNSYINIEKINNKFQNYDKEEIKVTLEELINTKIIIKKDDLYRYNFLQLDNMISTIKEDKLKDMIKLRLSGRNGQEIADKYGITRERVRQKINKIILNNTVQEDIYKNIVEEYNFTKLEFEIIFEASDEVYEYLKYKYVFGEKTIEQFLEDYPEYLNEEKNEKLLSMNKEVIYNNCRVRLNYTEILKVYMKNIEEQKSIKDILKEINIDFIKLGLQPINERNLEVRLSRIDNVICGIGKKYKFFDYINMPEEKTKFLEQLLNNLSDGYYSTLKIFKENEKFFKSINIEDEYEVKCCR